MDCQRRRVSKFNRCTARSLCVDETVCNTCERPHHSRFQLAGQAGAVDRHAHAVEPGIARFGRNFNVGMHGAHIGMAVVFEIKVWAAEKSRQEEELLNAGVCDAVSAQMQDAQRFALGLRFDNVIEGFDQLADTSFAARQVVKKGPVVQWLYLRARFDPCAYEGSHFDPLLLGIIEWEAHD